MNTLKIGFQGESGSYSEISAMNYFSERNSLFIPYRSFKDLFESVESSAIDVAVIPVENSLEGSVNETYDLLVETPVFVIGEIYQKIRHCLIANMESSINEIRAVYSHPQALAQCRSFIQKRSFEPIPMYDTAGSVKFIKENSNFNAAAIASQRAAEIYDMKILEKGIEDKTNNFTRFLVISTKKQNNPHDDKTSIIFSISHTPGSLYSILKEFAIRNINLTKIESRPTKDIPWEYYFFVDLEGNSLDNKINDSLLSVKKTTKFFKLLGSYKKAEII